MTDTALTIDQAITKLTSKSDAAVLPPGLKEKLKEIFGQLQINARSESSFWEHYQMTSKYIDWILSLPWNTSSKDILDLDYAREKLNEGHYGLDMVKERILEYVSVLSLQKHRTPDEKMRAPILLFVGL